MQNTSNIILGIDPGTVVMGFGLVKVTGSRLEFLDMGVIKLAFLEDGYERLEHIHINVCDIIAQYRPTQFAIEAPFYGKNVQSMLKLGRAQGVAIAAAMQAGLTVTEYSPKKVKQSITGNGNAAKEQVMGMLQHILQFGERPQLLDASDALAVALCHHYQGSRPGSTAKNKARNWEEFVKQNPGKISI